MPHPPAKIRAVSNRALTAAMFSLGLAWGLCLSCGRSTYHSAPGQTAVPLAVPLPDSEATQVAASPSVSPLRIVNAATQLDSVAGASLVYAYGTGLGGVTTVYFTAFPPEITLSARQETYAATLVSATDERLEILLPNAYVPTDGYAYIHALKPEGSSGLKDVAGGNTYVESAAPGFYTIDGSGQGAPIGTVTYAGPKSAGGGTFSLAAPLRPDPGSGAVATFWLTGGMPLPCPGVSGAASGIKVTAQTRVGQAELPVSYFGQAGPGYQQLNVDLTAWLGSSLAQDSLATVSVSVLACPENTPGGVAFWVDSNDVMLAISNLAAEVPPLGDPWPALSAQAPLTSTVVTGQHLSEVLPYTVNAATWDARAAAVRQAILDGAQLNPLPAKTPLNPIFSRLRMRSGYSVQNVAFEATPGFFVSGNLFLPLHRKAPVPAVLVPHGHFGNWGGYARLIPDTLTLSTRLAEMGAVVFTYDMVGWGDAQQLDHPDSYGILGIGNQDTFKDGTKNNLLELQLWDSIRSLDFVESLVDTRGDAIVDPDRIGITGDSGGATQSLYLAAVDPRVAAASLVVMIASGFTGDDHCEDGMPVHTVAGQTETNNTEIAVTIAPKPLLIISDGVDWTQYFNQNDYPYLKIVYDLFGAGDRGLNFAFPNEQHDYHYSKRARSYDFFSAAFGLPRLADTGPLTNDDPEGVVLERDVSLHVYSPGFPMPSIPMTHLLSR